MLPCKEIATPPFPTSPTLLAPLTLPYSHSCPSALYRTYTQNLHSHYDIMSYVVPHCLVVRLHVRARPHAVAWRAGEILNSALLTYPLHPYGSCTAIIKHSCTSHFLDCPG